MSVKILNRESPPPANWIDCTVALPSYGRGVLVWDGSTVALCARFIDPDRSYWLVANSDSDNAEWFDITHWAEVPDGPIAAVVDSQPAP